MDKRTVDELRTECRTRGLKGYSKLRKAELIALLEGRREEKPKAETVATLKARCKAMGLTRYSKLTKTALIALIAKHTPREETDDEAIIRRQAEMSASWEESVAMYSWMCGNATARQSDIIRARRLRAIDSIRSDFERNTAEWERWHVRYINESSGAFYA